MSERDAEGGDGAKKWALTPEQQTLFLEWAPRRKRIVGGLVRRFKNALGEERIVQLAEDAAMECAARFDAKLGVPFGAYAMKRMVYAVITAAREVPRRAATVYKAAAGCAELWLADPEVLFGSDEERTAELANLARQGLAAIILAGSFSRATATGGEDAMIDAIDDARTLAAVRAMAPRMREVLERRYGPEEETLEAIAGSMGVAPITARRAHAEALEDLRAQFG